MEQRKLDLEQSMYVVAKDTYLFLTAVGFFFIEQQCVGERRVAGTVMAILKRRDLVAKKRSSFCEVNAGSEE